VLYNFRYVQFSSYKNPQQSTTKTTTHTSHTTIKRVGLFSCLWFGLVSFGYLGSILCLCLERHSIQQHTTTSYKKSTKSYNKATKTTTHKSLILVEALK
jgi:hypothetical protein